MREELARAEGMFCASKAGWLSFIPNSAATFVQDDGKKCSNNGLINKKG